MVTENSRMEGRGGVLRRAENQPMSEREEEEGRKRRRKTGSMRPAES